MKDLKIAIVAFLIPLFSLSLVVAQPGPGPRMSPEERQARFQQIAEELELTEEQIAQFKALEQNLRSQIRELRAQGLSREDMFVEAMAIRDEQQEEIKAILTEEQYARFVEIQEETRNSQGGRKKKKKGNTQ